MQWVARIIIIVLGVGAAQDDQNHGDGDGDGSIVIKQVSPLEQLLATATASNSKEVSPLQDRQRVKRKPLRFRPKGESRFKPKNFKTLFADSLGKSKVAPETKSRFADFPIKQIPSEEPVKVASKVIHSIESTTTEQSEEAHDFLTTPEPTRKKAPRVQSQIFTRRKFKIPVRRFSKATKASSSETNFDQQAEWVRGNN